MTVTAVIQVGERAAGVRTHTQKAKGSGLSRSARGSRAGPEGEGGPGEGGRASPASPRVQVPAGIARGAIAGERSSRKEEGLRRSARKGRSDSRFDGRHRRDVHDAPALHDRLPVPTRVTPPCPAPPRPPLQISSSRRLNPAHGTLPPPHAEALPPHIPAGPVQVRGPQNSCTYQPLL